MGPLEVAISAVTKSGRRITESLGRIQSDQINVKKKSDYVTQVDWESESLIVDTIREHFPDHAILAEEGGGIASGSSYRWIIDPLDGTTNFIHGYPVCAVSVALEYANEIVLGVVYDPFRNELFHAEKNRGAYLNNQRISVTAEKDLSKCLIATGFPFKYHNLLESYLRIFSSILQQVSGIRRAGSAAIDLAYVACGRVDGFWEFRLSPWDVAAGDILVREAGGRITDVKSHSNYIETGDIIATNGLIHEQILREVNKEFQKNP